jgi:hypothetical protein
MAQDRESGGRSTQMAKKSSAGGSAMQGGARYQNQVAAWLATKMLAERSGEPIAPRGKITYIRPESGAAVDDILVGTDGGRWGFIQVKRKISLSALENSDIASVVDELVRQINLPAESEKRPWSRALNPASDRILLVTSSESPATLRLHLRAALRRASGLHPEQAAGEAAIPQEEVKALEIFLAHVRREWQKTTGLPPTEADIRHLLNIFDIEELDVAEDERDERESKRDLQSLVLTEPSQEHQAWTALVAYCGKMADERTGFDLARLRTALRDDRIELRAVPSFAADIAALRQYTETTLGLLKKLSRIEMGGKELKVERHAVTSLVQLADEVSTVVTGLPGAGKSGVIHDTARALLDSGRDVICFAVDLLELTSPSKLQEDLVLKHPVIEAIKAWDGKKKGVILIDALDAARGETAADTILNLIRLLKQETRWNVIASVRKWDLRNSPSLREAFRYKQHVSPTGVDSDPEFGDVNHLSVPVFSMEELDHVCAQSDPLQGLRNAASATMLELLRVPFNLRLAADMLDHGMAPAEFSPLRDQVGLLQAYWDRRVTPQPGGDNRERVLNGCLSDMVQTRRLRAARTTATATGETKALAELLSRNVLTEWQSSPTGPPNRQLLAFSHNVLFDFGAEDLYLKHEPDDFVKQLQEHPDLALLLRPSLHMRFQRLWMTDKTAFWDLTFKMCSIETLPALLKSCPLVVVAENAAMDVDVHELSEQLKLESSDQKLGAAEAYTHLVGVRVSGGKDSRPNLGEGAGPWLGLAADAMVPTSGYQIGDVQLWLDAALSQWGTQTREQMDELGRLARAMLERVWAFEMRNGEWAVAAIKNVCTTYGSDVGASGSLLRRALQGEHFKNYGHQELRPIVTEVTKFAKIDPDFIRDVYLAAFSWREPAEDSTFLNKSRLGSMLSTKRQDYEHRRWELGRRYRGYLDIAPASAIQVLFPVVEEYCRVEHNARSHIEAFQIAGCAAGIRDDYSYIWDKTWYGDTNAFAIFNDFFYYLKDIAENEKAQSLLEAVVKVFVSSANDAVFWRRLLEMGAEVPRVAQVVREAAWSQPLLIAQDTVRPMHKFLAAVHPTLEVSEKEKAENAIVALGNLGADTIGPARRDLYLGALNQEQIVTSVAKNRIAELAAASNLKNETPAEPRVTGGAVPVDPEQFYAMRGIGTEGKENQELVDLQRPIRSFASTTLEGAVEMAPAMTQLREAIGHGTPATRNEELAHTARGHLIEISRKIAKLKDLDAASELGQMVKTTLVEGVSAHWPVSGVSDAEFEGGWSSLPGRIDAAEGLFELVNNQTFDPEELFPPILQLAHDPLPVVRFQVARLAGLFHDRAPDRMWELVSLLSADPNYRNRIAIVDLLSDLGRAYPERAMTQLVSILDSAPTALGKADELAQHCIGSLIGYYAWRVDPIAQAALDRIIGSLPGTATRAVKMIHPLRDALKYTEPANPQRARDTRVRSAAVFNAIVSGSGPAMRKLIERKLQQEALTTDEETMFDELQHLLEVCAGELYFAVGAFNEQSHILPATITTPEQPEIYKALSISWDQLAGIGSPQLVHKLIQSLELFIPIDPETVFSLIGKAALAGKLWRYQQEPEAASLIARIVSTYIADHRSIFQKNASCLRVLREVLDLFISAGWPAARQLSYRVDEVFR